MTNPNDSAQPVMGNEYINQSDQTPTIGLFGGLTKREHFAAMAMQGYISAGSTGMPDSKTIAGLAIETADALIEALNKDHA